jgi:hypothetical protein
VAPSEAPPRPESEAVGRRASRMAARAARGARRRLGQRAASFLGLREASGIAGDVWQAFGGGGGDPAGAIGTGPEPSGAGERPGSAAAEADDIRRVRELLEQLVQEEVNDGSSAAERDRAEGELADRRPRPGAPAMRAERAESPAAREESTGLLRRLVEATRGAMRPPMPVPSSTSPTAPAGLPGAPSGGGSGGGVLRGIWSGVRFIFTRGRG